METTNNNPATKRQRFALWLASKACGEPKDFREVDLTVSQAAELLKQYNKKSGYNNGKDSTIQHNDQPRKQHNYKEEFIEFFKAKYLNEVLDNINNVLKQVSVVYNADIFGNPTGGQSYKFYGSGCACAWLEFRKCKRYEEINSITGRNMLLWNGGCHVHGRFSLEAILQLKKEHPEAKVLVHPECPAAIQAVADEIGSTAGLLNFAIKDEAQEFIVATESGILHKMQQTCPDKQFYPAPPEVTEGVGCSCNECSYMRLNTLEKLYKALKDEKPEIQVDAELAAKAVLPINKMLELSK